MPITLTEEEKQRKFKFIQYASYYPPREHGIQYRNASGLFFQRPSEDPYTLEEIQRDGSLSDNQLRIVKRCKPGCTACIVGSKWTDNKIYALSMEHHWNPIIAELETKEDQLTEEFQDIESRIIAIAGDLLDKRTSIVKKIKAVHKKIRKEFDKKKNKF